MGVVTKPLFLLAPPLLFVASLPLALLASLTTLLAVSLLALRVSVVYVELALALAHAALFPEPAKPLPHHRARPPHAHAHAHAPPSASSPPRIRRTSCSPTPGAPPAVRLQASASLVNVDRMASARDFEGVGGWSFCEGDEDEAVWMSINKRLELPLALPPGRRHQRRHTGGDQRCSGSPELLRMSPLHTHTKIRTPPRTTAPQETEGDDYFPPQPVLRPLSTASEPLSMSVQHSRRASLASVGGSTSSSSSPTSVVHKQAGE